MTAWPTVRWSSADQVIAAIGEHDEPPPVQAAIEPAAWFRMLAERGDHAAAIEFIAHALARYDCVVWATQTVLDSGQSDRTSDLVRAIMRWIDDPQEAHRRTVQTATGPVTNTRPEYLLGMAVFFSGGSISAPQLPAVLPPPNSTAKMAAAAIFNAADKGDRRAIMRSAVERGEAIAAARPAR